MKTFGSLMTGFGLVDIGARAAGYTPIWGNEYDAEIAGVASMNGLENIVVENVLALHPKDFERPDLFHASPVCTRASNANSQAEKNDEGLRETKADVDMAEKIAEFIVYHKPPTVTLENVMGYKHFRSFKLLVNALADCGYMYDVAILNAADFGVPQTRKRLFCRAVLGGFVPFLPSPVPWVGWYSAIEDIIDTLPADEFADWQLARLPEFYKSFVLGVGEFSNPLDQALPIQTITSNRNQSGVRAFLIGDQQGQFKDGEQPSMTVNPGDHGGFPRGFLMPGAGNTNFLEAAPGRGAREFDEPAHTISADGAGGRTPRAFLLNVNASGDEGDRISLSDGNDPAFTVGGSSAGRLRAFVVDGMNAGSEKVTIQDGDDPFFAVTGSQKGAHRAFLVDGKKRDREGGVTVAAGVDQTPTVTASQTKHPFRAWLSEGRVVAMTPRALARFQTIPDDFILPKKKTLAGKGIGNGVPCLMYQRIAEAFIKSGG